MTTASMNIKMGSTCDNPKCHFLFAAARATIAAPFLAQRTNNQSATSCLQRAKPSFTPFSARLYHVSPALTAASNPAIAALITINIDQAQTGLRNARSRSMSVQQFSRLKTFLTLAFIFWSREVHALFVIFVVKLQSCCKPAAQLQINSNTAVNLKPNNWHFTSKVIKYSPHECT